MIASLRGLVAHKDLEGAIIECAGVGYGVAMSAHGLAALAAVGSPARLWVYTHVAEDSLRLYAFDSLDERRTFEVLLATAGVGPKLALTVLSTLTPDDLLAAVSLKDRGALTRIPGVGAKKAERLLLELSGRLVPSATSTGPGRLANDVVGALTHLGFEVTMAQQAARAAQGALPECTDVATLTRHALQRISHRPKAPTA